LLVKKRNSARFAALVTPSETSFVTSSGVSLNVLVCAKRSEIEMRK